MDIRFIEHAEVLAKDERIGFQLHLGWTAVPILLKDHLQAI